MGDRPFAGIMLGLGLAAAFAVAFLATCARPLGQAMRLPAPEMAEAQDAGRSEDGVEKDGDDMAEHVAALAGKVPPGFTVVEQPPFVVIGDEPASVVKQRASGTVKASVDALKADFFEKDPDIIDIWLFRDADSYMKHAKLLFGDEPDTPYGYYSEDDRALVMNIGTGGGTLVHEIVHPFMHANFPGCPPWLNEGMGSLYEQSMFADGHLVGLTNWRLAGLQEAIEAGTVPSFEWLTSRTSAQFYGEDPGTNYSQSRYLLLYLQQEGLLVDLYHAMVKGHDGDPTGYHTLASVLGEDDMADFQVRWEKWVRGLVFEG